jgi:hypothetical protein
VRRQNPLRTAPHEWPRASWRWPATSDDPSLHKMRARPLRKHLG